MKKLVLLGLCVCLLAGILCGCGGAAVETDAGLIVDIPTTQYFTDEAVSEEDTEQILWAGINAPSAMNGQKWHFSAITDRAVLEDIASSMKMPDMPPAEGKAPEGTPPAPPADGKMPEGNPPAEGKAPEGTPPAPPAGGKMMKAGLTDAPLAIVISCPAGGDFDAGLACQNMSAAAQLMGYGTKILSSTTIALNGERKPEFDQTLGIPEGYSAVAVLLVGKADSAVDETVDGYTGATPRNPFDQAVTYVKP